MQRNVFTMKLQPGCAVEYKKRHQEIWPELQALLRDAGLIEYAVYLDELTGTLFAVQRLADKNTVHELPGHEVTRRWWAHMAELIDTNVDNSPLCKPLEEVFHLEFGPDQGPTAE
ncbi:MAG TPA: L-rhamnose mutarotase [Candidatus Hydrogenedentes bacterium]|nr:L-rhamnose mutarotase [Candidatus Hydrogenedentota bacterium]HNT88499.1 L-rhamnose mutarotase [Candidatus Hydrogenedentota bacterium]